MPTYEKILASMEGNPKNVRFSDALKVAEKCFGPPRVHGSHHKFRTPWAGDPMVNLQDDGSGKAKAYQVRQLLAAVRKLEEENGAV